MTLDAFTPIDSATLGDHAYGQIRLALMSGRFEPGEKLTIRSLSAKLNISPTPIREALRRIAAERGVEIAPNRYIRVPIMMPQEMRELRDIRTALEGVATERAVAKMDAQRLAELKRLDAAIRKLRAAGEVKPVISTIQQFHFTLYRASDMPALVGMIEGLWLRTAPYVNLLFPGYTTRERGGWRAKLLQSVVAGDAKSARQFMESDIRGALDYIIAMMEDE